MRVFESVEDSIAGHTYPATAEELITEYGDIELELPNGEETFGDVLGRIGETTFENAEDARLAAYSVLPKEAIGRQNYSDRDSPAISETGPDPVSF
jgi:hypothetical protein